MREASSDEKHRRRIDDLTDEGIKPTVMDAWHSSQLAHKRLDDLRRNHLQIDRSFVKDDLGTPDYEGHRKAHLALMEADKVLQSYKQEATKKVLGWVIALFLGAIGSGFLVWLKSNLK